MKLLLSLFATAAFFPTHTTAAAVSGLRRQNQQPDLLSKVSPNPDVFEAAMSLEDFKNVDPDIFEWVNPDEIKAGETTCGYLTAPLVWEIEEVDVEYPTVKTCK